MVPRSSVTKSEWKPGQNRRRSEVAGGAGGHRWTVEESLDESIEQKQGKHLQLISLPMASGIIHVGGLGGLSETE